jgi:hypothetical protein
MEARASKSNEHSRLESQPACAVAHGWAAGCALANGINPLANSRGKVFQARAFTMKAIARTSLLTVALLAINITVISAEKPVTLKDTFKEHFLVGTAVNRNMVTGGAGFRRSAEQSAKDIALVKEQLVFGNSSTAKTQFGGYKTEASK